jgi:hypothetical protein
MLSFSMSARAKKVVPAEPTELRTPSGATAGVEGDRIVVRNSRNAVVVVYDAEHDTAEITAGDLTLSAPGGRIALRASEIVCDAGRFELRADRILERAGDVYREVEGLLQTRAERVRALVRGTFQLFAKRAQVVAEEDASVDGKRVLLG